MHHLANTDLPRRIRFCRWILRKERAIGQICHKILWSDESRFTNNGWFNRNVHYRWTQENNHLHRETNFQERFGINVWLGVLHTKIIGPYFFENTLTADRYLQFLQHDLDDYLDNLPLDILSKLHYFQQDGAPPHTARVVRNYLNNIFPDAWIGNNGPISWPARSPDLTIMDFFVWGYVKDKVYLSTTRDLEHLKEKITLACRSITPQMLSKAFTNSKKRFRMCVQEGGRHIEHLL